MPVHSAPCSWEPDYSACAAPPGWADLPAEEAAKFEEMATTLLWQWTGQNYGVCPATINPLLSRCPLGWTTYGAGYLHPWHREVAPGGFPVIAPCSCAICEGAPRLATVILPGPVVSVDRVLIDGEELASDAYGLTGSRTLVRSDGGQWPSADETLDWIIEYQRGTTVPIGGRIAAGILAIELWKASCQDKTCALPQRVQSITRQGVSMAILDDFDDIGEGRTGIWLVDSWVASIQRPTPPTRVFNPNDLDRDARPKRARRALQ